MENYNIVLTEKQQKYQHYHLGKSMYMNIFQAKKYYLLIKANNRTSEIFYSLLGETFGNQTKTWKKASQRFRIFMVL